MMVNNNYSDIVAKAKANHATFVNFDQKPQAVQPINAEKDKFTLSDAALAKMNGSALPTDTVPTYIKPTTARTLLAKNEAENPSSSLATEKSASDLRFDEMMQSILDKRLGVDREKLKEIEAMMDEIAKNENMSPEEKQKAIEQLQEMREKLIEESLEIKKVAKESFTQKETK